MDLEALVARTLAQSSQVSPAARQFLEGKGPRYAMGRNPDAVGVHQVLGLDGIIDDFYGQGTAWQGIPVVKTRDVPVDAWVVNCSTSISPVAVRRHLARSGFEHVLDLHELVTSSDDALDWPAFVTAQRKEIKEHLDDWTAMFQSLADETSRRTFLDILRYRLSADPGYMEEYAVRIRDQYFEDFMRYEGETFIDAGGYDGDTAQAFADRYPDYRKIILFEPSETNMRAARERLAGYRDIEYRTVGLSDASGTIAFDQDSGSASAISGSGTSLIAVDTLDAAVTGPVSVIKMDLEGWETNALRGAVRHIRESRPKLAIAVYHAAADFRLVHQFVTAFGHDYECYLRHYTQGWSETVMFFCNPGRMPGALG